MNKKATYGLLAGVGLRLVLTLIQMAYTGHIITFLHVFAYGVIYYSLGQMRETNKNFRRAHLFGGILFYAGFVNFLLILLSGYMEELSEYRGVAFVGLVVSAIVFAADLVMYYNLFRGFIRLARIQETGKLVGWMKRSWVLVLLDPVLWTAMFALAYFATYRYYTSFDTTLMGPATVLVKSYTYGIQHVVKLHTCTALYLAARWLKDSGPEQEGDLPEEPARGLSKLFASGKTTQPKQEILDGQQPAAEESSGAEE